jgi:hypothetical protein
MGPVEIVGTVILLSIAILGLSTIVKDLRTKKEFLRAEKLRKMRQTDEERKLEEFFDREIREDGGIL